MSKKKIKKIKLFDVVKARANVHYHEHKKELREMSNKELKKALRVPLHRQSSSGFHEWSCQKELKRRGANVKYA